MFGMLEEKVVWLRLAELFEIYTANTSANWHLTTITPTR
jgi:hypothetical protein